MKILQLPKAQTPWTMRAVCGPRPGAPNPNGCGLAVELLLKDLFKLESGFGPFKTLSICWKCPLCLTNNYLKPQEVPPGTIQTQATFLFKKELELVKEIMTVSGLSLEAIAASEGFDERTYSRLGDGLCGTIE